MSDQQNYISVTPSEIIEKAGEFANNGYRLIQMACTKTSSEMDVIYSFETQDLKCEHLKMAVNVGDTIPSISGVFFAAFLYENEIHDLYGVNYSDMIVDFNGTFYETSVKHAFSMTGTENKE